MLTRTIIPACREQMGDNFPQEKDSLILMESDMDDTSGCLTPTADQYFLLYFIMGVYFAPDLKKERPHKSVFQRRAEGLPTYSSKHLAGSHIKTVELEGVYYYVLRKADKSLIMKLPWLRQFFCGKLNAPSEDSATDYPQFDSLFSPKLHQKSRWNDRYDVIENIAFINDPEISYIKPVDVARFQRLTGLKTFLLDRDDPLLQRFLSGELLFNVTLSELQSEVCLHPSDMQSCGGLSNTHSPPVDKGPSGDILPLSYHSDNASTLMCNAIIPSRTKPSTVNASEPRTIFLPSCPSEEDWSNIVAATKGGISLAGSAARGQVGPVLGLIDIGESDDSYLFRVSLPGVKRDESK